MSGQKPFNPDSKPLKDKVIHISGDAGGMLVGNRHSKNGIKAINKSTGQPLEMEGGEVVITRNAVSDTKKRSFNGKPMTNREILSAINVSGGGVSFAEGGDIPKTFEYEEGNYEYGGETCTADDLVYKISKCGCDEEKFADGGDLDTPTKKSPAIKWKNGIVKSYSSLFDSEKPKLENLQISIRLSGKTLELNSNNFYEFTEQVKSDIFPEEKTKVVCALYTGSHRPSRLLLRKFYLVNNKKKNTINQLNIDNYSYLYQPIDLCRILDGSTLSQSFDWTDYFFGDIGVDKSPNDNKGYEDVDAPDDIIISSDQITTEIIQTLDEWSEKDNFLTESQYQDAIDFINQELTINRMALQLNPIEFKDNNRVALIVKQNELLYTKFKVISEYNGNSYGILANVLRRLSIGETYRSENDQVEIIGKEIFKETVKFSDAFKEWFGDWEKAINTKNDQYISKAVDENGVPEIYYNGSSRKKYTYNQGSNGVFYLAQKRSYAKWFAKNASSRTPEGNYLMQCYVSLKNPIDLSVFKTGVVDFTDIATYLSVFYPSINIFDFLPDELSSKILMGEPTGFKTRAWQVIRNYPKLNKHIRSQTDYDGYLYYENNPSDVIDGNENITKAIAVFNSSQVKLTNASMFNSAMNDFRFKYGGKV